MCLWAQGITLHPIPPLSGGGVGEGIWRLGSSYSLHAVWSGVPRALMLLPTLRLLLGQLRSYVPHTHRLFCHLPMSIKEAFTKPVGMERNGPASANQGLSTANHISQHVLSTCA